MWTLNQIYRITKNLIERMAGSFQAWWYADLPVWLHCPRSPKSPSWVVCYEGSSKTPSDYLNIARIANAVHVTLSQSLTLKLMSWFYILNFPAISQVSLMVFQGEREHQDVFRFVSKAMKMQYMKLYKTPTTHPLRVIWQGGGGWFPCCVSLYVSLLYLFSLGLGGSKDTYK